MKILLTILLIFVLTGCSNSVSVNNDNFGADDKKLKATSDKILDYKKIKNKNGEDIVKYSYLSDVEVEVGTIKNKGKDLIEDVSKREKNARMYQDGEETVAQIYGSKAFLKDNGVWKHTEVATSTISDFESETEYTVAKNKKHTLFGIRTAWAASPESIYASSGDGDIFTTQSTWDATHDATDGATTDIVGNIVYVYSQKLASTYRIRRGFLPFNTSIIPDDATIVATSSIYAYPTNIQDNDNDGDDFIVFAESERTSTSTLAVGDYSKVVTDIDNIIELTERIDLSDMTVDQYEPFALNSTGFTIINKTGWTNFMGLEGHDVVDSAVVPEAISGVFFSSSEETGTGQDPYIVVTYTEAPVADTTFYEPLQFGVVD